MLVVQKYGGTSVGDIDKIRNVASRIHGTVKKGYRVVAVVSAMAGETERLLKQCAHLTKNMRHRECDAVVATGEQVSAALLALALHERGVESASYQGHQLQMNTIGIHGNARINNVGTARLLDALNSSIVPVVTGFQGVNADGDLTTLGRGGSDTSAVAIAAALKADACEIYTDVSGIYTADPRVVSNARKIERISYEEMLDLSSLGAKVLQLRSVECGMKHNVPIHVRSSFESSEGTWVVKADNKMESMVVSGITMTRHEAIISVSGLPDTSDCMVKFFSALSSDGVVVDMILKNQTREGTSELTCTVPRSDMSRSKEILSNLFDDVPSLQIVTDDNISKVSVVGLGMRSHDGVASKMFEILANEGIPIRFVTTSEINISVVIDEKYSELAIRALHDGFELHK